MIMHMVSAGFSNPTPKTILSWLWKGCYYFWGNLKNKVYRTDSHTEEELKENIHEEILEVTQEELLWVNINLFKWYRECVHVHGPF
jgi:hypothetical protein